MSLYSVQSVLKKLCKQRRLAINFGALYKLHLESDGKTWQFLFIYVHLMSFQVRITPWLVNEENVLILRNVGMPKTSQLV